MSTPTVAEVCEGLLVPLHEIAEVRECNGHFQDQLYIAVKATGKTVDELTVRELRELIEAETVKFNRGTA